MGSGRFLWPTIYCWASECFVLFILPHGSSNLSRVGIFFNYMFIHVCITSLDLYIDFNVHHWLQIITYLSHSSIIDLLMIYPLLFISLWQKTLTFLSMVPGSSLSDMGKKKKKQEWAKWYIYYSVKSDNILERLVNFCKTLLLLCRSRFMSLRPCIFYENVFCLVWVFEVISYSGQKAS